MIILNKYLIQTRDNNLFTVSGGNEYTENLIPIMTSNTTPSGIASASSIHTTNYDAWEAFDKIKTNCWSTLSNSTGWIKYEFSEPQKISKYTILSAGSVARCPKNWTFEGSNDGVNWTVLDTRTNITVWSGTVKNEFVFNNTNLYIAYRINISANNGDTSYLQIAEMEMMGNFNYELDRLQGTLSDVLFINRGVTDPTIINNQTPTKKGVYALDKGTLGTGKQFEINLEDKFKSIISIQ